MGISIQGLVMSDVSLCLLGDHVECSRVLTERAVRASCWAQFSVEFLNESDVLRELVCEILDIIEGFMLVIL